ncbi:purine/pyrimidine permease [Escherichia coli]|nr:hypothetical protein [Escherichia coli]EJC8147893.1 purine/pyrimidine permease [Escherichia coli]
MFNFAVSRESLLSGFQWFFFIFCNTVVVPPTLLSAFQLPQSSLLTLTQYAFLATALACFAQAFCGHRRAIMEGPGGLWWGTILTITLGEASRGTPINDIATSLAVGIILTAVITGLVNISNTYGAIRGTDVFYPQQGAGNTRYRRSFVATGFMTLITVPLAVIPFSPFVSSIGLLTQTGDYTRRSFIYGSVICLLVALVPALTRLFCSIPLPVSSAVMLVSYLPLLFSALVFSQQITFTARNIYRLALPLFVGIFLMALPPVYLQDLPLTLRPLLSNGLLVGILLAVLMDNLIPWERIE